MFRKKYRQLGIVTLPYIFVFEFMAPVIEVIGFGAMVYLILTGGVNWNTFWILFGMVYIFAILLSQFVLFFDYIVGCSYNKTRYYWSLLVAAFLEPMCYHPFITYCFIRGYLNHILKTKAKWGERTHKRYHTIENANTAHTPTMKTTSTPTKAGEGMGIW